MTKAETTSFATESSATEWSESVCMSQDMQKRTISGFTIHDDHDNIAYLVSQFYVVVIVCHWLIVDAFTCIYSKQPIS